MTYRSGGLRIRGFLGRPLVDVPRPLVVYNHGGDHEVGALEGWEVAMFAEAGYVAVASQYRGIGGSDGSEEFGAGDVDDVLDLIALMKKQPYVDSTRIGMMGHSRGGMMTYLALKEESRRGSHDIRAAVTVGGLADLFMQYDDDPAYVRRMLGATPSADPAAYERRSATRWPERIGAPLLLEHGEADTHVLVAQSRRLADGLLKQGRTVRLVVYPGEDHELTGHHGGLPEGLSWLQEYLARPGEDYSFQTHGLRIRTMMDWFQAQYRRN